MRATIQRVSSASVTAKSQKGSWCLLESAPASSFLASGIATSPLTKVLTADDTTKDVEYIAKKILTMRVFDDSDGTMWKAGVKDIGGESSTSSREVYSTFLKRLGELYEPAKIKDGQFGAMMRVSLVNEGPVTLQIDSRKFEYVPTDDTKPSKKARSGTATPATPGESTLGTAPS
ncbi:D-tyrosyl-tRNA(Tyr) deacylase [Tulasnella sp. UAMH 9824]|nr:D-tyrosyl-tRNA(Tyr) deacylase [Tulasnella sp. UAMH 9824]